MSRISNDFTFTWIIRNYSIIDLEHLDVFQSPQFTAENISATQWSIGVCVKEFRSEKFVTLQLIRHLSFMYIPVTLEFEMDLCNSKKEILCTTKRMEKKHFCRGPSYNFDNVISLSKLNNSIKETYSDTLILNCRMFERAEIGSASSERSFTFQTTPCLDELSYTREVEYSKSPEWETNLYFTINAQEILYVNIRVRLNEMLIDISQGEKEVCRKVKCEITLLEHEGTEKRSNSDIFTFSEISRTWHFPSFPIKSLLKQEPNIFRLKFYFAFSYGFKKFNTVREPNCERENSKSSCSSEGCLKTPSIDSLKGDLHKMLFSKQHSDVSFRIDGEVISAHKFILASRSPIFSAMFDHHQMAESETGVVDISDMDVRTLKLFLEFVYTAKIEDPSCERMVELLLAAEKYQVQSLKEECSRFLEHHLSADNVCDVVSVADTVGEHTLKEAAIAYIKENFAEVFSSSKWSDFVKSNVKLCAEIIYNFSNKLKER